MVPIFIILHGVLSLRRKGSKNKMPKGIMRSAVPLPCLFDVVKSQNVAGQRPRQGTKSCRMGRNSVHLSTHTTVHLLNKGSEGLLEGSEGYLEESEGLSERSEGHPEGSEVF